MPDKNNILLPEERFAKYNDMPKYKNSASSVDSTEYNERKSWSMTAAGPVTILDYLPESLEELTIQLSGPIERLVIKDVENLSYLKVTGVEVGTIEFQNSSHGLEDIRVELRDLESIVTDSNFDDLCYLTLDVTRIPKNIIADMKIDDISNITVTSTVLPDIMVASEISELQLDVNLVPNDFKFKSKDMSLDSLGVKIVTSFSSKGFNKINAATVDIHLRRGVDLDPNILVHLSKCTDLHINSVDRSISDINIPKKSDIMKLVLHGRADGDIDLSKLITLKELNIFNSIFKSVVPLITPPNLTRMFLTRILPDKIPSTIENLVVTLFSSDPFTINGSPKIDITECIYLKKLRMFGIPLHHVVFGKRYNALELISLHDMEVGDEYAFNAIEVAPKLEEVIIGSKTMTSLLLPRFTPYLSKLEVKADAIGSILIASHTPKLASTTIPPTLSIHRHMNRRIYPSSENLSF